MRYAGRALAAAALVAAALACAAGRAAAQPRAAVPNAAVPNAPAAAGFDPARLARIDTALQGAVDRGEIAGAVALVLRDGRPVYERAVGWADRAAGRPMTPTTIFRIASQTKALTSVAALSLVEEGRLGLNDPVERYIPAFARTTVAVRPDTHADARPDARPDARAGARMDRADTGRTIVPARRPITVRDLLTHTAGVSYGTDSLVAPLYAAKGLGPAAGYGWYLADKREPVCATVERLASLPFVAQPGERFVYGYSTDVLGCLVERAAGLPLDSVFRARITGPLGMRDTRFYLPPGDRARLATVYASAGPPPGGTAISPVAPAPPGARGQGDYVTGPRASFSGGAGLLSTAPDYARFLEALRRGGTLGGTLGGGPGAARVLAPSTVALMTSNQTGTLFSPSGEGFGLGFATVERAGANGRPESVGTFGWGGAYGSTYEVDPRRRLVLVFMLNQLPNTSDLPARFPMLVYQALVRP